MAESICTLRDLRKVAGNVEDGVAEGRDLLLPAVPSRPGFLVGGSPWVVGRELPARERA